MSNLRHLFFKLHLEKHYFLIERFMLNDSCLYVFAVTNFNLDSTRTGMPNAKFGENNKDVLNKL